MFNESRSERQSPTDSFVERILQGELSPSAKQEAHAKLRALSEQERLVVGRELAVCITKLNRQHNYERLTQVAFNIAELHSATVYRETAAALIGAWTEALTGSSNAKSAALKAEFFSTVSDALWAAAPRLSCCELLGTEGPLVRLLTRPGASSKECRVALTLLAIGPDGAKYTNEALIALRASFDDRQSAADVDPRILAIVAAAAPRTLTELIGFLRRLIDEINEEVTPTLAGDEYLVRSLASGMARRMGLVLREIEDGLCSLNETCCLASLIVVSRFDAEGAADVSSNARDRLAQILGDGISSARFDFSPEVAISALAQIAGNVGHLTPLRERYFPDDATALSYGEIADVALGSYAEALRRIRGARD